MASPPESPTDHPADETTSAPVPGVPDAGAPDAVDPTCDGFLPDDDVAEAADGDWDTDLDVPLAWGGTDTDGEDDWDGADWDGSGRDGETPEYASPQDLHRTRKRRWRRRRRVIGTLVFLLVVGGLGYVVARATGVTDDDTDQVAATTTTAPSTTTTLPLAGPYRVLDGLNARAGPGASFPALGTIKIGETVMVMCVADGDLVNGPNGQSTKWLEIATPFGPVYVTAAYVAVSADLTNPEKIAPCPT